jgi:quinol monooxygenase YgiN
MTYSRFGTLRARPGQRDAVVAILVGAVGDRPAAGCLQYLVIVGDDPDLVLVSELWESPKHHRASLDLPETREAIGRAMPLLTGEFTGLDGNVVGGIGA